MTVVTPPAVEKIPLVIGVTGHRNLHPEEMELLQDQVRQLLRFLQQRYPDTPLLLLSPLAEGADRLVAKVALAEKIRLIVPLPLPVAEYQRDFDTPALRQEFTELLEQAEDVFELPQLSADISQKKSEARNLQYVLVGAYVARHSHILIALWDGKTDSDSAHAWGSTYQVIQFRLSGDMTGLPEAYKPSLNPLDLIDTGKVCHFKVSRSNDPSRALDAGELTLLSPSAAIERGKLKNLLAQLPSPELDKINEFNQAVAQPGAQPFNKPILPPIIRARLSKSFQTLITLYEQASWLSIAHHRPTERLIRGMFGLGIGMVLAIGLYGQGNDADSRWFLLLYCLLFAAGYGLFGVIQHRQLEVKYLHYRALAEALRVQIFWQLSGLTESVADFYLRKHRSELEWIRSSLRALCTYNWVNDQLSLELVQAHWLSNQQQYFQERVIENRRRLTWSKTAARSCFMLGLLLTVGLLLIDLGQLNLSPWLHNGWIILMMLFPAIGAAIDGYAEKVGYDAHLKRYTEMAMIYQRAQVALSQQSTAAGKQRVLLEIGKAALEENSDWVLLHRERPLKKL